MAPQPDPRTDDLAIVSERLVLREFVEGDADDVLAIHSHPDVARFMDFHPETLDQARAWLAGVIHHNRRRPREAYNLAIALPDGSAIGWIGFGRSSRYPTEEGEFGVGYMLARDHWGRGYGTEALRTAIAFMVGHLGARRVSAWCWIENVASARVLEKAGMRLVGRSERAEPKSGSLVPCLEYAMSTQDG